MGSVGKVWLITCDCRALVQALAEAVLASGHNLVATAADGAPLNELLERYGDQLRVVPIDVTNELAAESAIEATLDAFGRLDVLVLDVAKWRNAVTPATCLRDLLVAGEAGLSAGSMTGRTVWSEGSRGEPAFIGNDNTRPRGRAG
jgi:NAD(P)-dependent dehydrogenase (short-subunit alcohol dehydrogenase family)